ncbi:hypothetical protein HNR19_002946 [Nocardioides thalensis]|uniref:Uncharacterized protein n=1 Tax=Nocardioides thalensis TaxID=1914755 RepID=A0A853C6Z5_9ACTN|nr:hypothetical protein [Nocardioides thalensis]NYJ02248.1 hypothetical protein [Nocardioides thalensis]
MPTDGRRPAPPRIQVSCLDGEECKLFIEPWGAEFTVRRGAAVSVESHAFAIGAVDVCCVADGISIAFTTDVPIAIVDGNGRRHRIG